MAKVKSSRSLTPSKTSKDKEELFEKDVLRSLRVMRKDNFEAKKNLKSLYNHKIDKLKEEMLEDRLNNEKMIKEKLKF